MRTCHIRQGRCPGSRGVALTGARRRHHEDGMVATDFLNERAPYDARLDRASNGRAGIPTTVVPAGTSCSTTALAPTRAPSPIVTPPMIFAPDPIKISFPSTGERPRLSPMTTLLSTHTLRPPRTLELMTTAIG